MWAVQHFFPLNTAHKEMYMSTHMHIYVCCEDKDGADGPPAFIHALIGFGHFPCVSQHQQPAIICGTQAAQI